MTWTNKNKNSIPDIKTFGCRLNIWESQVISDHASNYEHSDLIIFNTCAVTSEAERQARQAIRSAKKNRPSAKILVTGCAAQIDPNKWNNMPEVNFVVGNKEKLDKKFWKNFDVNSDSKSQNNIFVEGQKVGGQELHDFIKKGEKFPPMGMVSFLHKKYKKYKKNK